MNFGRLLSLASIPALVAAQYLIWVHAPMERTMGLVQKIFYYHLPMAWWSFISFFTVFVASVLYLAKRKSRYDHLAGAAAELGVLCSGLALITGTLWARPIWNVWWTWDPRLTTTLIMWFVYAAYLLLRASDLGGGRRAVICAVLGVVAFADVPLVFYSARMWRSVHPAVFASKGGGLDPDMWLAVAGNVAAVGLLWLSLLLVRYRQLVRRERIETLVMDREEE